MAVNSHTKVLQWCHHCAYTIKRHIGFSVWKWKPHNINMHFTITYITKYIKKKTWGKGKGKWTKRKARDITREKRNKYLCYVLYVLYGTEFKYSEFCIQNFQNEKNGEKSDARALALRRDNIWNIILLKTWEINQWRGFFFIFVFLFEYRKWKDSNDCLWIGDAF